MLTTISETGIHYCPLPLKNPKYFHAGPVSATCQLHLPAYPPNPCTPSSGWYDSSLLDLAWYPEWRSGRSVSSPGISGDRFHFLRILSFGLVVCGGLGVGYGPGGYLLLG